VLRFTVVRRVVVSLIRYLISLLVFAAAISAVSTVGALGAGFDAARGFSIRYFGSLVASYLPEALTVAAPAALLVGLFSVARQSALRFSVGALLTVATAGILGPGIGLTEGWAALAGPPAGAIGPSPASSAINSFHDSRGTVHHLYVHQAEATEVSGVGYYTDAAPEEGFRYYPEAFVDRLEGVVVIPDTDTVLRFDEAQNAYSTLFRPPAVVEGWASDVRIGRAVLRDWRNLPSLARWGHLGSIALLVGSLWVFVDFTRWPLFNAVLAFVAFRGVFSWIAVVQSDTFFELAAYVLAPAVRMYAPAIATLVVAFALFFVAALVHLRRAREEEGP